MSNTVIPPSAKETIGRLPRTFRPALNGKFQEWELLFPAERRSIEAQLDWLSRLPPDSFQRLFAPIVDVESRMELPGWDADAPGMSVRETGILARSPEYPRWRQEVQKVFARIDQGLEESGRIPHIPQAVLCVLPSGLPLNGQALWPELGKQGTWVPLDTNFGSMFQPLVSSLARRKLPSGVEPLESTWVLECESSLSALVGSTPATVLSWPALKKAREEFTSRLNRIARDLHSVDKTNEELAHMDMQKLLDRRIGSSPRTREFVRAIFLSGNGSILFNNSFVQWGASETLRRVQPQVLVASFGIRQKLKPFSSVVLFENQKRKNPTPDALDPAGSLVDSLILAKYVYLTAERVARPLDRRLTLMTSCDLDRILVLSPNVPAPASGKLTQAELTGFLHRWLAS